MERQGYQQTVKIRYDQVDSNARMSAAALLAALQDAAISHSDALGYSLAYMAEHQWGWAVIHWHIRIYRMPMHLETVCMETWSNKCRKMQAERSYFLFDGAGEKMVDAISRWIFMDVRTRKPTNVPEHMIQRYGSNQIPAIEGETFQMPTRPKEAPVAAQTLTVARRDTDTNGHANNVKYLEWVLEDIPDDIYEHMDIQDMRLVYRKECRRGDTLQTQTYVMDTPEGTQTVTFLTDAADTVLAEIVLLWAGRRS